MRIIAGEFRGRRLVAPPGMGTRPTTDRVREAWFSILGPLEGSVIDLYAGTGALGFEALSRGAERVTFVENARLAQEAISKNAATLGVSDRVSLIRSTVEHALPRIASAAPYDLILTDPPWTALEDAEKVLRRLLQAELLTKDGRLVLGHPKKTPIRLDPASGLLLEKERAWGDSAASFFVRKGDEG